LEILKSGNEAKPEPKLGRFENTLSKEMEVQLVSHTIEGQPFHALVNGRVLKTGI
jgi:hypothetical protein